MAINEQLDVARGRIDDIDRQMLALFDERMNLADEVAAIKRQCNLAITDEQRESTVVNRAVAGAPVEFKAETAAFMRSLIGLSKSRQRRRLYGNDMGYSFPPPAAPKADPAVVFQGVRGAWAEQAALQLFAAPRLSTEENWEDVFTAVSAGRADYGVLPIENSQTGGIGEVYDLLRKYGCYIVGQTWVAIEQCLMAAPGTELTDIREVLSHPEGFKQCYKYLRGRSWDLTACRNTAVAAEMVANKQDKRLAAIGSARAAELYGLSILSRDIVSDSSNKTRFILIAAAPEYDEKSDAVSVIFRTAHRSGALCDVLFPLQSEGINMTRLESRPMNESGKYCFFCDLEGHIRDEAMQAALQQAAACCGYLEILGCYRRDTPMR